MVCLVRIINIEYMSPGSQPYGITLDYTSILLSVSPFLACNSAHARCIIFPIYFQPHHQPVGIRTPNIHTFSAKPGSPIYCLPVSSPSNMHLSGPIKEMLTDNTHASRLFYVGLHGTLALLLASIKPKRGVR